MKKIKRLVRDHIPTFRQEKGEEVRCHSATDDEFRRELNKELLNEVEKYSDTEVFEDLLDVVELVYTIAEVHGMDSEMFKKLRLQRREELGGFDKKMILDATTERYSKYES